MMAPEALGHTLPPATLVHGALDCFAVVGAQKAELVKLRYLVGLTFEEAASVRGVSEPTAKR